ncbi:MAG: hypothetical protein U1F36_02000 [Planctomycetota bacterium]
MPKPVILLILVTLLSGCSLGDFYDKEYVLYDGNKAGAPGSPARPAQEAKDAEHAVEHSDPGTAAAPARDPRAGEVTTTADVDRIFMLQNLLDELDRAIRDQAGDAARLAEKRAQVEAEIAWRRAEAGPLYDRARALRLEQLARFPIVLK